MKIDFWNPKNKKEPRVKSLRSILFNVKLWWTVNLGLSLLIFCMTALFGIKFFYTVYFESYKEPAEGHNFGEIINSDRLQTIVERRVMFIDEEPPIMKDPSI